MSRQPIKKSNVHSAPASLHAPNFDCLWLLWGLGREHVRSLPIASLSYPRTESCDFSPLVTSGNTSKNRSSQTLFPTTTVSVWAPMGGLQQRAILKPPSHWKQEEELTPETPSELVGFAVLMGTAWKGLAHLPTHTAMGRALFHGKSGPHSDDLLLAEANFKTGRFKPQILARTTETRKPQHLFLSH